MVLLELHVLSFKALPGFDPPPADHIPSEAVCLLEVLGSIPPIKHRRDDRAIHYRGRSLWTIPELEVDGCLPCVQQYLYNSPVRTTIYDTCCI